MRSDHNTGIFEASSGQSTELVLGFVLFKGLNKLGPVGLLEDFASGLEQQDGAPAGRVPACCLLLGMARARPPLCCSGPLQRTMLLARIGKSKAAVFMASAWKSSAGTPDTPGALPLFRAKVEDAISATEGKLDISTLRARGCTSLKSAASSLPEVCRALSGLAKCLPSRAKISSSQDAVEAPSEIWCKSCGARKRRPVRRIARME